MIVRNYSVQRKSIPPAPPVKLRGIEQVVLGGAGWIDFFTFGGTVFQSGAQLWEKSASEHTLKQLGGSLAQGLRSTVVGRRAS